MAKEENVMTIQNPIGDYYYSPPNYYQQPYTYTWPQTQTRTVKKIVTEREFSDTGALVKETVTETTETIPYKPYFFTSNVNVNSANVPNVEADTAQAVIDNINNHTGYSK
jgi:hypothetical protein